MKKYILELIRVDILDKLNLCTTDDKIDKYLQQLNVIDEILHEHLTKQNLKK